MSGLIPTVTHILVGSIDLINHLTTFLVQGDRSPMPFGMDMSIESLRSRKFSVGIFGFLIVSLILFSFIIYLYLPRNLKNLKKGEKIMFGAIIMGMVLAVLMGWLQLIDGYLL